MNGMTVAQVARTAEVTNQSVRTWAKKGLLTPVSQDGKAVFDPEQVRAFLASRAQSKRRGRPSNAEGRARVAESRDEASKAIHALRTAARQGAEVIRKQQVIIASLQRKLDAKDRSIRESRRAVLEEIRRRLNADQMGNDK